MPRLEQAAKEIEAAISLLKSAKVWMKHDRHDQWPMLANKINDLALIREILLDPEE